MKRLLFVVAAFAAAGLAHANPDPLSRLPAPILDEERAWYEEAKSDPKELEALIATRIFVRKANAGGDPGRMPANFSYKYTVSVTEQMRMYTIAVEQRFKKSSVG